jgi:hypothetical protein
MKSQDSFVSPAIIGQLAILGLGCLVIAFSLSVVGIAKLGYRIVLWLNKRLQSTQSQQQIIPEPETILTPEKPIEQKQPEFVLDEEVPTDIDPWTEELQLCSSQVQTAIEAPLQLESCQYVRALLPPVVEVTVAIAEVPDTLPIREQLRTLNVVQLRKLCSLCGHSVRQNGKVITKKQALSVLEITTAEKLAENMQTALQAGRKS